MDPNENLQPGPAHKPDPDNEAAPGTEEVHEGRVPVEGSEAKADELAKKAYGDKDADGEGDVPNVPFPG